MVPKIVAITATVLAIGLSLIHLRQPLAPLDPWSLRLIHLGLGMAIAFLIFPVVKKRKKEFACRLLFVFRAKFVGKVIRQSFSATDTNPQTAS